MTYLLHEKLDDAFAAFPDRVAIDQDGATVTYAELDRRADCVARVLIELRREQPEAPCVGVSAAVTIDTIAAVLGALRAGLAYVPLEAGAAPERLAQIVADARLGVLLLDPLAHPDAARLLALCPIVYAAVGLGDAPDARRLAARPGTRVIDRAAVLARDDASPLPPSGRLGDDLACVLYTAADGATGPRGVMLTHRNARTFVDWMGREFRIAPEDRVMSRASLAQGLAVFDVFNTLAAGATLLVHDPRASGAPAGAARERAFVDAMRARGATVLCSAPSTFAGLIDQGGLDPRVPLRLSLCAGEPLRPALLRRLMAAMPATWVVNLYGPTETSIVAYHWVEQPPEGEAAVPIGRESDDTEIAIVREDGRPCAPREVGEIWVRGGTVCLGYLGRDELTRERLVRSPFHPYPATFWRTGDYGFRGADGELVFVGRRDELVEVRGQRIELGAVEAALAAIPEVGQAVVVALPHPRYGHTLHAVAVPRAGASVDGARALRVLAEHLPEPMVPCELVVRTELPRTASGEPDRRRLARELSETSSAATVAAGTTTAAAIAPPPTSSQHTARN